MATNKNKKVTHSDLTETKERKSDLRRLKTLAKLLKDNSHIQSIEVAGDNIKLSAFPPKQEIVKQEKPLGALKAPPADSQPLDEFAAFKKKWADLGVT